VDEASDPSVRRHLSLARYLPPWALRTSKTNTRSSMRQLLPMGRKFCFPGSDLDDLEESAEAAQRSLHDNAGRRMPTKPTRRGSKTDKGNPENLINHPKRHRDLFPWHGDSLTT
jgi:hypothetical protein